MTLGGGAGSGEGVGMGGRGAVALVTSWGLGALAVRENCHSLGPVSLASPRGLDGHLGDRL